jgi:hypothetical protein
VATDADGAAGTDAGVDGVGQRGDAGAESREAVKR